MQCHYFSLNSRIALNENEREPDFFEKVRLNPLLRKRVVEIKSDEMGVEN